MFNRTFLVIMVVAIITALPVLAELEGGTGAFTSGDQASLTTADSSALDDRESAASSDSCLQARKARSLARRALRSTKSFFERLLHPHPLCEDARSAAASSRRTARARTCRGRSIYRPVAGISPANALGGLDADNIACDRVKKEVLADNAYMNEYVFVKYSDDAIVRCTGGPEITLDAGDILVFAWRDTFITAGEVKVVLAAGAVAVISQRHGALSVRNLWESHQGCIGASVGGQLFPVRAGEEFMTGPDFTILSGAARLDNVQRRNLSTVELSDGRQVLKSEFDTTSLFKSMLVLRQLAHSANAIEKSIFAKVLKMTACLQVITGSDGYKPVD